MLPDATNGVMTLAIRLYDRGRDEITLDDVEWIAI
jgi:hypothetical protein